MDLKLAFKKIRTSVAYGLSNDIGGRWGKLLWIYTFLWVIYALFMLLASFSNGAQNGFFALLAMLVIVLPVLTLPPFLPIHLAWKRHSKRLESETIRKKKEKEIFDQISIKVDVPSPLKMGTENPIKLTVDNPTGVEIRNVRFRSNFPTLVKCDEAVTIIDSVPANSSKYTAIFIIPRIQDAIDLGDISVKFDIHGSIQEKGSVAIGTHEVVGMDGSKFGNDGMAEKSAKGDVQKIINVSIKDSLIQRSNLLSSCDLDGDCIARNKDISCSNCKTELSDA